jgi:hypothetical protein
MAVRLSFLHAGSPLSPEIFLVLSSVRSYLANRLSDSLSVVVRFPDDVKYGPVVNSEYNFEGWSLKRDPTEVMDFTSRKRRQTLILCETQVLWETNISLNATKSGLQDLHPTCRVVLKVTLGRECLECKTWQWYLLVILGWKELMTPRFLQYRDANRNSKWMYNK